VVNPDDAALDAFGASKAGVIEVDGSVVQLTVQVDPLQWFVDC